MALVFSPGAGPTDIWRRELARLIPDLDFRVWPDYGDPAEIDIALVWRPAPGTYRRFPNLKAILSAGAGVDGIKTDPELPPGVPVARLVDPWMANAMAEFVLHWVLHYGRRFDAYADQQRRQEWRELDEEAPFDRARVGLLGCGQIGGVIARQLMAIGCAVAGWTRRPQDLGPIENFPGPAGLIPFLRRSDYLVCVLPLTPETQGVLNRRALAWLPNGAVVINIARGAHLVEGDLLAALDSGHLKAAVLDVFAEEPLAAGHAFWKHPAIVVTPHIAGTTNPVTAAAQVAENIRRIRAGAPLLNPVDPRSGY
ncbi:MAG: glyoxylate/hydroxypyruvate reductase A [Alphaproteobacteria bacterium]|nr:glyoxylate/hydroxypyruvate reductase A [Alphaproteobacteria bacterium]